MGKVPWSLQGFVSASLVLVEKLAPCGSFSLGSSTPLWDFVSTPHVSHFIHLRNKLREDFVFPLGTEVPWIIMDMIFATISWLRLIPWNELLWSVLVPWELGPLEGAGVVIRGGDLLPGNVKCSET